MSETKDRPRRSRRKEKTLDPTDPPKPQATEVPAVKADGSPKAVKADGTIDKRGGYRPGAGRKPIHERLTNYHKCYTILDDAAPDALMVLVDGLEDEDKYFRVRCAELLLKKTIADKKQNELVGPNGGAIVVSPVDIEEAVLRVDGMIQARMEGRTVVNAEFKVQDEDKEDD